jgi:hypothetical protein
MAAERLPVQLASRVLGVSEPGYYEWRGRAPSRRAVRHAWLTEQIQAVHQASRGTYGARRVHAELTLGLGITVGTPITDCSTPRGRSPTVPAPPSCCRRWARSATATTTR